MQNNNGNNLQDYFTDREDLRDMFDDFVSAQKLPKRLFFIYGDGGMGKSSLMQMFYSYCKRKNTFVAITSAEDVKSIIDIMKSWAEGLNEQGIVLHKFSKTLKLYETIDAKMKKELGIGGITSDVVGVAVSGSAGPVVGTIARWAASGTLGATIDNWMRNRLSKDEADMLRDPVKKFTSDFLEDIANYSDERRIVLLLDTFEKISILGDQFCDIVKNMHPNVLVVISGRELPDWNRAWFEWRINAEIKEIKPLREDDTRLLINRYYKALRGKDLDTEQVEQIIKLTSSLPLETAIIVNLWMGDGTDDFKTIKSEGVAGVVEWLTKGMTEELIRLLEAASIVRRFDETTLMVLLGKEDVRNDYLELRKLSSFVKQHGGKLAVHDVVRDSMNKDLRNRNRARYCELHSLAADLFAKQLERDDVEDNESLELEQLYHCVCANEKEGTKIFIKKAEEFVQYRFQDRLRTLLNDVNTYPLEQENSILWRKYYFTRLRDHAGRVHFDEIMEGYEEILKICDDSYLRAKILLRQIEILERDEYYVKPDVPEIVELKIMECENLLPEDDWERFLLLMRKTVSHGRKSFQDLYFGTMNVLKQYKDKDDYYAVAQTCQWIKGHCAMHGRWKEFLDIENEVLNMPIISKNPKLLVITTSEWQIGRVWMGRYAEAEEKLKKVIEIQSDEANRNAGNNRDLLSAISFQRRSDEVIPLFEEVLEKYREQNSTELIWVLRLLGIAYMHSGDIDNAKKYLSESVSSEVTDPYRVYEGSYFLGFCYLIKHEWIEAEKCFSKYLSFPFEDWCHYFKCGSLIGLARAKEAIGKKEEIMSFLADAEKLAQQHEYNDHLATIRLMEGHQKLKDGNQDEALALYQKAMIYALRYNRFLLDDLIGGRPQGTPMIPIIQFCLENGEDGREILMELRDWWKVGSNDIGTPRPDTISQIDEDLVLFKQGGAEYIARKLEPGDRVVQKNVVEQIDAAL